MNFNFQPKTLVRSLPWAFGLAAAVACASSGPQRYRSFFQALEMTRTGEAPAAREAFEVACSQNSSAACHRLGKDVTPVAPLPILQGPTIDTATSLVVLADAKAPVQYFLWEREGDRLIDALSAQTTDIPATTERLTELRYEGLTPGNHYRFQVVGAAGELVDGRELQTLNIAEKRVVFAVASCLDDRHTGQKALWEGLLSQDPQMIFLIGDNVYADTEVRPATPEALWKRYLETRKTLELFRVRKLVPVFSTWDDHDYGLDDGDRTYVYRADAKKIFQAFFGREQYPGIYDRGPGVASRLTAFGQRFFFLDDRSFRSPKGQKGGSHLGVDQESWLFTDLFTSTPAWLIDGDQFFGGYHKFESFEGSHPENFTRFLRRLKNQSSPIAFLSGDRHLAELMEIGPDILGYPTFELTTSSLHGKTYAEPWTTTPNPRKVEGAADTNNYAMVETEAAQGLRVTTRVYGPDRRRLFSRFFEVKR